MAFALKILIICPAVVVYYVIMSLSKIKQYENEKATLNHFFVHMKYKYAAVSGFAAILLSLFPIGLLWFLQFEPGSESDIESIALFFALVLVPIFYFILVVAFLIPIRYMLEIKENQITSFGLHETDGLITLPGTKKTFTFELIKAARINIVLHWYVLQLTDSCDEVICSANIECNNINLLIERLKDASVIGINKAAYETPIPEKIQYPENNTFIIQSGDLSLSFASCMIVVCISVAAFIIAYFHDPDSVGLPFAVFISAIFIYAVLNSLLFKITYANGVFECRDFIGLKRKFEMKDISYIEFWPHASLFKKVHIFLKTGKRICSINCSDDNLDLLLDTLKGANIEFR